MLTIKPTLFFSSLGEYLFMSLSPAQSEGPVLPFVLLWYNECTKTWYKGQDSIVESWLPGVKEDIGSNKETKSRCSTGRTSLDPAFVFDGSILVSDCYLGVPVKEVDDEYTLSWTKEEVLYLTLVLQHKAALGSPQADDANRCYGKIPRGGTTGIRKK